MPDAVEAAARVDRLDDVSAHAERFRHWAEQSRNPLGLALLARCRELIDEENADHQFAQAIELAPALSPFDQASTARSSHVFDLPRRAGCDRFRTTSVTRTPAPRPANMEELRDHSLACRRRPAAAGRARAWRAESERPRRAASARPRPRRTTQSCVVPLYAGRPMKLRSKRPELGEDLLAEEPNLLSQFG